MKILLSIALLAFLIFSCKKEGDEKKCYICTTYREETYKDGTVKRDTGSIPICQTDVWILKFIQNGTQDGESWSKETGKDTVYYYLKAKTECKLK